MRWYYCAECVSCGYPVLEASFEDANSRDLWAGKHEISHLGHVVHTYRDWR